MRKKIDSDYLRNILFGAEDSLVSTVGVLFGLSSSHEFTSRLLIITGMTLIAVEAISMGVGSYLAETEVHEIEPKKEHKDSTILDGVIMFFSYLFFGFITLFPYIIFPINYAGYISITTTLGFLFLVGYAPTNKIRDGLRMFLVAGFAILIGFLIANIF